MPLTTIDLSDLPLTLQGEDHVAHPNSVSDALRAPFPTNLIEHKDGKSYISHDHIRDRVIEATGNHFDWDVSSIEYRADGLANRTDKVTKERFAATVMIVSGTLTIHGLGRRNGMGVQVLEGNMGEDGYKMAESDAFKRAAMAFGVGLRQLYMGENGPVAPVAQNKAPTREVTPPDGRLDLNEHFDDRLWDAREEKDASERKQRFGALYSEAVNERDTDKLRKIIAYHPTYAAAEAVLNSAADHHQLNDQAMIDALAQRTDNPNRVMVDQDTGLAGTMTDKQRRTMFAIQKDIAFMDADLHKWIKDKYDIDSRTQLSEVQANQVIDMLKGLQGGEN